MNLSKEELKSIIHETMEEKLSPLKEEIDTLNNSINRDLKLNYLNSIGRLLEREAKDTIDSFSCSYHNKTELACKNMLNEYISKYTSSLAMGDMANAFSILEEFQNKAEENARDFDKGNHCKKDWAKVSRILKRHKDVAKDVSALFTTREVPVDIGEMNFTPEELYDNFIFPLSHPLRIQIIHALKSGSKRFTTLKNELEVKNTGLLVHHLKPLTEAELVTQDYKKEYSLSDKGFTVARYFAQLTAAMHPDDPVTVEMQPLVVLQDD